MRNYLRTMISLKEIGNKGYDYNIARDICGRIYTVEDKSQKLF